MAQSNPYEATQTPSPVTNSPAAMTPGGLKFRLSVMMFLEFFIWGAWLPPSFGYLGGAGLSFEPWQTTWLYIAFPIAAILAMFGVNQFVDRNFAAQRFLAFSQLIGGIAMLAFGYLAREHFSVADPGSASGKFWTFFALMAVHCLFYVPTFSVTNTIAFANLKDPQKDFGPIRLWGTIGWIAASWPFIFILVDWTKVPALADAGIKDWLGTALASPLAGDALNQGKSWAFIVSGIASLILAGFSLFLPHTPPKPAKKAEDQFAAFEVMKLLKHPFILVLFIVTFIDAMVHDGFFFFGFDYLGKVGVPSNWLQPAMTVGQIAEILTMAILGYVLKSLGWRTTMIFGVLGHAVRFAVFAMIADKPYAPTVAVAINLMHGICYAFFFATVYIFVDEFFPKDARTSAQGLFNFLIFGMGPIAGRFLWPYVQSLYTTGVGKDAVVDYSRLLYVPSLIAVVAAAMLLLFFHPPKKAADVPQ